MRDHHQVSCIQDLVFAARQANESAEPGSSKCERCLASMRESKVNRVYSEATETARLLWCREGELNPQGAKHRRILSPLRLPVPPSRLRS